jgi:hypothetical protein
MIILGELGGVRVFGNDADAWKTPEGRKIGSIQAVFDSDIPWPEREIKGEEKYFVLPCHRREKGYQIHLLETGEAIVLKDGCAYFCTLHEEMPLVLEYQAIPIEK